MKEPNVYQSSSISFVTELPKGLGLHEMVDFELQFEKVLLNHLDLLQIKCCGE